MVSVCNSDGRSVADMVCSERDSEGNWTGRQQADCQGGGSAGGVLRDGMDLAFVLFLCCCVICQRGQHDHFDLI